MRRTLAGGHKPAWRALHEVLDNFEREATSRGRDRIYMGSIFAFVELYDKARDRSLAVYGEIHEESQLLVPHEARAGRARKFIEARGDDIWLRASDALSAGAAGDTFFATIETSGKFRMLEGKAPYVGQNFFGDVNGERRSFSVKRVDRGYDYYHFWTDPSVNNKFEATIKDDGVFTVTSGSVPIPGTTIYGTIDYIPRTFKVQDVTESTFTVEASDTDAVQQLGAITTPIEFRFAMEDVAFTYGTVFGESKRGKRRERRAAHSVYRMMDFLEDVTAQLAGEVGRVPLLLEARIESRPPERENVQTDKQPTIIAPWRQIPSALLHESRHDEWGDNLEMCDMRPHFIVQAYDAIANMTRSEIVDYVRETDLLKLRDLEKPLLVLSQTTRDAVRALSDAVDDDTSDLVGAMKLVALSYVADIARAFEHRFGARAGADCRDALQRAAFACAMYFLQTELPRRVDEFSTISSANMINDYYMINAWLQGDARVTQSVVGLCHTVTIMRVMQHVRDRARSEDRVEVRAFGLHRRNSALMIGDIRRKDGAQGIALDRAATALMASMIERCKFQEEHIRYDDLLADRDLVRAFAHLVRAEVVAPTSPGERSALRVTYGPRPNVGNVLEMKQGETFRTFTIDEKAAGDREYYVRERVDLQPGVRFDFRLLPN